MASLCSQIEPRNLKKKNMTVVSELPEHVMEEILSRLPRKSLMRFKCVRKSWNALIESRDFAAKHLSVSEKHNSSTTILFKRTVVNTDTNVKETVLSLLNLPDDVFEHGDDRNLNSFLEDVRFPVSIGLRGAQIAGHCDGIVCLQSNYENERDIVLCNPAIKEFKLLPKSRLAPDESYTDAALGFGFDHKSKNYKLVRMFKLEKKYDTSKDDGDEGDFKNRITRPPKSEIYNLSTNSWKEIETGCFVKEKTIIWPHDRFKGVHCKGILYWMGVEQQKEEIGYYTDDDGDRVRFKPTEYIISLDLSDETFRTHETHVVCDPDDPFTTLGLWNESVALCCSDGGRMMDIWKMDESGSSWTKYLTFKLRIKRMGRRILTLFERGNGDVVWVGEQQIGKEFVLNFYNVHTRKYFSYLPRNGANYYTQSVQYVNSIVSIK